MKKELVHYLFGCKAGYQPNVSNAGLEWARRLAGWLSKIDALPAGRRILFSIDIPSYRAIVRRLR